jgi:hypothetical protein
MPTDPLDLWPDVIRVEPLTPLRVLQLQADRLRDKSQGRLVADIVTSPKGSPVRTPDEWGPEVVHRFEIVAQALDNCRHQLAVCIHQRDFAYPALVVADTTPDDGTLASSQDEFVRVMRDLLNAKSTVALIESLMARIAEAKAAPVPA